MNKVLPLVSLFIISIVSLLYWTLKPKEDLYDAKWNAPDTTLAITINGEISTSFPATNAYTGTVECTTGTGKVEWNGSKWVLTASGIAKGSTKCNATFITRVSTLTEALLANNEVQTPITTPGSEVSAYKIDDVSTSLTSSASSEQQSYFITYGTGWKANGTNFDLTGAKVTSSTYANSYSSLVGKYLPYPYISSSSSGGSGSSTAGTMVTTTDLTNVYYVISATSSTFTYKTLGSNKNTTEALLASTPDDYGTSYYFRGTLRVIDLDSCKIAGNMPFCSKYLSRMNPSISDLPGKYKLSNFRCSGDIIPNKDTDLYCYIITVLNTLFGRETHRLPLETFYDYLEYLRRIGVSTELIDIISDIYSNKHNTNPRDLLDGLEPVFYKCHESVFKSLTKQRRCQ